MSVPHLHRVDAVLHELGAYTLERAKEILRVESDVADTVVELSEEGLRAMDAVRELMPGRVQDEWRRTVTPLCERIDALAGRVDAADAYARSVSSLYRQARGGSLGVMDARNCGAAASAPGATSLEDAARELASLADEAERLRDQVASGARLPRLLQDGAAASALSDVVERAKGWYLGVNDELFSREQERIADRVRRELAPADCRPQIERTQAAGRREKRRIAEGCREGFARILSPGEVDLLDELANLSLEGISDPGARTSDFLLLGWAVYEPPAGPFSPEYTDDTPELLDVLRSFEACYGDRLDDGRLIVPQLIDRSENCSVTVVGNRSEALPLLGSLAALELAGTRAGMQRFLVIDCSPGQVGLSQWLPFVRSCPQLLTQPVITSLDEAAEALQHVSDEVMAGQCASTLDLVERTAREDGTHAPLTTVIAIDMPPMLEERLVAPLVNIATHGTHAGVNLLVSAQPPDERDRRRGLYDLLASLPEENLLVDCLDDGYGVWGNHLMLEPADWSALERVREGVARAEREAELRYRGISGLVPDGRVGHGDATERLSVPFGIAPDGSTVALELGDAVAAGLSHFALATGTTGTGKSSLLHTLILSALSTYGPDELELYLLDFKQGVEFEVYRNYRLPQVRVVALDADQAFGVSVLESLSAELARRARLYQDLGVTSYAAARRACAEPLPRVLVVLDEFQVLLSEATDRRAASRAAAIMRTFFQTARAFGMHFVMATQALSSLSAGCSMGLSDLSQVNVRIGLNNSEAEHARLFGEGAAGQARRLIGSAKGSGAYLVDKDAAEPDVRAFRACYCDDAEKDRVLGEVQARDARVPAEPTLVYRGTDVPRLSDAEIFSTREVADPRGALAIPLGESARMGQRAVVEVSRTRRSSLLAVTEDAAACDRLAAAYVAGAAWSGALGAACVYVLDAHALCGDGATPDTRAICRWAGPRVRTARSDAQAVGLLDELAAELERRAGGGAEGTLHLVVIDHQISESLAALVEGHDLAPWRTEGAPDPTGAARDTASPQPEPAPGDLPSPDHFDALLARLDALTHDLDQPAEHAGRADEPVPSRREAPGRTLAGRDLLARLLDLGHGRGINVALFTSDYLAARELRYQALPKLAWRVAQGLSEDQCHVVIPDVNPAALRANMAVMWDGRRAPLVFKPYRIDAENLPALP